MTVTSIRFYWEKNIFKSLSSRLLPTTKVVIFGLCGYMGGWVSKYLA